jgi:hypothetical protein
MGLLLDREPKKIITHALTFAEWTGGAPKRKDYWMVVRLGASDSKHELDIAAMENLRTMGFFAGTGDVKVRKLPIRVDSDDLEDFIDQSYQLRVNVPVRDKNGAVVKKANGQDQHKSECICKGDGVNASRMAKGGVWNAIPCGANINLPARPNAELLQILRKEKQHDPHDGLRCPFAQNGDKNLGPKCGPETVVTCRCDVVGNIGGFARYRSHSHHTADRLVSSFREIREKLGFLADVPLWLCMEKQTINTPDGRRPMELVHVELRVTADEALRLMEARLAQRALIEDRKRKLLMAKNEPDDPLRLAEEFPAHTRALSAPKTVVNAEGNGVVLAGTNTKAIDAEVVQPTLVDVAPSTKPFDPSIDGDR